MPDKVSTNNQQTLPERTTMMGRIQKWAVEVHERAETALALVDEVEVLVAQQAMSDVSCRLSTVQGGGEAETSASGIRLPINVSPTALEDRNVENERAFATICPICNRRYGIHDDEEMRICFPALVAQLAALRAGGGDALADKWEARAEEFQAKFANAYSREQHGVMMRAADALRDCAKELRADSLRTDAAPNPTRIQEIQERWNGKLPEQLFSSHVKMDIDYLLSLHTPSDEVKCTKCGRVRGVADAPLEPCNTDGNYCTFPPTDEPGAVGEVEAALVELREMWPNTYCDVDLRSGGHVRFDNGDIQTRSSVQVYIQYETGDKRFTAATLASAMAAVREFKEQQHGK